MKVNITGNGRRSGSFGGNVPMIKGDKLVSEYGNKHVKGEDNHVMSLAGEMWCAARREYKGLK